MMFWVWLLAAAVAGLLLGVSLVARGELKRRPILDNLAANEARDRELVLRTLRRELANWLIWQDPDRYLNFYKKLYMRILELRAASKFIQNTRLKELIGKYPEFVEFDLLGVKEHVLYGDAFSSHSNEEIEEHFNDLAEYQELLSERGGRMFRAVSRQDLDHLEEYVGIVKDIKFRRRMKDAVMQFSSYRRGQRHDRPEYYLPEDKSYETDKFTVRWLDRFELTWGYHFLDTNEYGLHTIFDDYENKKTYVSFYRSDETFEAQIMLHPLTLPDES